jgi:hypothetical protein
VPVFADSAFNAFRSRAHSCMRYARAQRPVPADASFCRASFCRASLCRALRNAGAKKWPRKIGAKSGRNSRGPSVKARGWPRFSVSKSETREVAIARRDPGAGHQQPVDRGHQAAEQAVGGYEADGSSLGHGSSLFRGRRAPRRDLGLIYVYQMPGTMHLFA